MLGRLEELHKKFGVYEEGLVSVVKEGRDGEAQIQKMMANYRSNAPSEILGEEVVGNSGHHQGVSDAGDLDIVGRTSDGLIEAVELQSCRFLISIQWHPEMCGHVKIFERLIEVSSE